MKAFSYRGLAIETTLAELIEGNWSSGMSANSVIGSLLSLSVAHGVHVFWTGNHQHTADIVEGIIYHFLRAKFKEVENLSH